jgi:hypothetical protein
MKPLMIAVIGGALAFGAGLQSSRAEFLAAEYFPLGCTGPKYYRVSEQEGGGPWRDALLRAEFHGPVNQIWELRLYIDGNYDKSVDYSSDPEGLWRHRDRFVQLLDQDLYELYEPPLLLLPAQMDEGMIHTASTSKHGQWYNGSDWIQWTGSCERRITVVGVETVTVPAGALEALRIDFVEDSEATSSDGAWSREDHLTGTEWYVNGLGLVRLEQDWADAVSAGGDPQGSSTGHTSVAMIGVPEPSVITLLIAGAICLAGGAWRRSGAMAGGAPARSPALRVR